MIGGHGGLTSEAPFDIVTGGDVPFDDPAAARAIQTEYEDVGVTWWIEGVGTWLGHDEAMVAFIRRGPSGR
ncbi:MAG TPA: hypothetical protein VMM78_13705 [Thermomicrobiales bacterium]|nr:hypothetical protein [Thermomicrobiales bacterium]